MGAAGSCVKRPGGAGTLSGTTMTLEQYAALQESVDELAAIKDGPLNVGIISFKGLFANMPDTFPIFEFQDTDWEHSHHFQHHCKVVMNTIVHVIKVFGDNEKLIRNMDVMGMRHSMLNLPPRHFKQLGMEILIALREVLGEKLTPEKEEAWVLLYEILSDMLQSRMKKYNADIGYTLNLS